MRINIVIDDDLMKAALELTGLKTESEVVDQGLNTLVRLHRQKKIRACRGKLPWEGTLDQMRLD